eukprot:6123358-Prymnesium_polylepis.1
MLPRHHSVASSLTHASLTLPTSTLSVMTTNMASSRSLIGFCSHVGVGGHMDMGVASGLVGSRGAAWGRVGSRGVA